MDEAIEAIEALGHRLDSVLAEQHDTGADERRRRITRLDELETEMLAAARRAVIATRRQPGADPRVVDRVLSRLDARGVQPRVVPQSDQADG